MSLDQAHRVEHTNEQPASAVVETRPGTSGSARAQAADLAAVIQDQDAGAGEEMSVQAVQLDGHSPASLQAREIRSIAGRGLSGQAQALPHLDQIQAAFGAHDVSGVQAHVGGSAKEAARGIGAKAYTSGDRIAFGGTPDLWTAAHEAAHVVQQRTGVQLKEGVGETGDSYEKHANAVADKVVSGQSAEPLLSKMDGGAGASESIQLLGQPLDKESKVKPAHGEDKGTQRRFTPEQYMEMWEEEQGRKLSAREKKTIARGCIGLTATNVNGGGNPLDSAESCYADFDKAHEEMLSENQILDWLQWFGLAGEERYVLFAKLFWSNQDPDPKKRKKSDPKAFIPDADTGKVDMSDYKYERQPGYVNFDYGWWDDASQCFWHANHMDYGDPDDPMIVLQSTRDKFAHKINHYGETRYGYIDFDRVVYCIALAKNYNPGLAAIASAQ